MRPVEEGDTVIPVTPKRYHRCQHPLSGEDGQPNRHQVLEIPPIKPAVIEYQVPSLVCPRCGEATRARVELPSGVPTGEFGPRVQAVAAVCTGAYHVSKRTTQGFRFVEAMMTVVATLKQQRRNLLDYLTAASEAALRGEPAPSLIPTRAELEKLMRAAA